MKYDAVSFSFAGDKYLGTSYKKMDCQAFVEKCMSDVGLKKDLAGSNSWYREIIRNGWVGSPEECMKTFGQIPKGALLFILKHDGKEPAQYQGDGIGNASHIGICIQRHDGAIHSSSSKGGVCYSKFQNKTIPNGGWNRVGLYNKFTYGKSIDWYLEHGGSSPPDDPDGKKEEEVIPMQGKVTAPSGSTVKLRQKPSTSCNIYWDIPIGTEVLITDYGPEWCKVVTGGLTGYMMTEFLEIEGEVVPGEDPVEPDPIDDVPDIEPDDPDQMVTLRISAEAAAAAYQFMKQITEQIEQQIGRG